MTATTSISWQDANQRYLTARLSIIRNALRHHIARAEMPESSSGTDLSYHLSEERLQETTLALPGPAAVDRLCELFGLSPFERDLLLLCAGMELDSAFASLCAAAHGNPQRPYPTFSLALAVLPEAHWSALIPVAPLRRWRLIEVGSGDMLTTSQLRIDERVLHYLAGVSYMDGRLSAFIEPTQPPRNLPPSHRELGQKIARIWSQSTEATGWPVVNLCGPYEPKEAIVAFACATFGVQAHVLRIGDIPQAAGEREALSRLWERESVLAGAVLIVDAHEYDIAPNVLAFIENIRTSLVTATRDPLRLCRRHVIRLDVRKPNPAEQQTLWEEGLGAIGSKLNGQLDTLVSQFRLGVREIHSATSIALANIEDLGPQSTVLPSQLSEILWNACRAQARSRLDDLAERIEPAADWKDLVVPEVQIQTLQEIAAQARKRAKVYETWGFASKGNRGLGITALFAGASGTGKTLAAEIIANDLRLDLYRIDLSQVVSKYIGETEKNLRRVFDAAEESGAVLLFDEADALFGKRGEVKDSHDRYANIEISFLLQKMESYRGLAILTTNIKSALDDAFLRRIRFIVQFPFPDLAQRAEIWRSIFPAETPTNGLEPDKLARLNVAGGNIRNIALYATFLAAEGDEPVNMSHLLRAARAEYGKLERPLTEAEIRGWL